DFRGQLLHGRNDLQKVHAAEGVHLAQHFPATNTTTADASAQQAFDLTAPVIDFLVADGRRVDRAQTSGAAEITISPVQSASGGGAQAQRTVITASRFDAEFAATPDGKSKLSSMHGAPDAKIVNLVPGLPDRVSTSQTLDAEFLPEG